MKHLRILAALIHMIEVIRHTGVLLRRTEATPEERITFKVCAPMRIGWQEESPQDTAVLRCGNPRRRSASILGRSAREFVRRKYFSENA